MGREKKKKSLPQAMAGGPKERHRRIPKSQYDPKAPMPIGFVAKPTLPKSTSRHHTYFEFVENTNKKKKLEFEITTKSTPPPGFEFVPIGNPALTKACKELSREKDAMIFIVSNTKEVDPKHLSHHVHRTGHHIREAIVEEARANLEHLPGAVVSNGLPEPLPASQEEYTAQANAAILDLFPRIPNTDRQSIIMHAFNLALVNQRPKPVGLSADMLLSRRVQLAVLAHIRHTHTRYDELLRETSWQNARKVVEALCLDILVKWRGDEETGRDQLDEILREVVIISDSGSEESEEEDDTEDSSNDDMGGGQRMECDPPAKLVSQTMSRAQPLSNQNQPQADDAPILMRTGRGSDHALQHRTTARKEQRGFKRYRAWEEAIQRNRELELQSAAPETVGSASRGSQQYYGSTAHPPGPMAMDGGAGSVPEPNGFVPRQSHSSFPIAPLSNHSVRPPHDQVTSSVHDQTRTTPGRSRRITPVTDRFQDMLVRSIEPASPETTMQPSFVRALPPRPQPSPARHSVPFRAESTSPFRETVTRERPFYVDRRVVSDRPALDPPPQGHPGDPFGHQSAPRYYESRPVFHSPLSAAEPRSHQSGVASAPARRIAVGPCRPGERFNPILMEDRGGFFERVPAQLETTYSHPSNADMGSARWQPQASSRLPEPHGVVSWEEGSRILRESRNDRDVEVIPMSGPPTLPPGTQPHATPVGPHSTSDSYGLWAQRQPQGPGHHGQVVEPLPPRRDYMGALQEPHQGALYDRQPPGSTRYYQQPAHPQHYGQAPYADPHGRPDSGHPPRGGDNIIVLE